MPIVNENDTVAVQELRIGDNDTLSAQVATLVQAEWLFLLTDVPNLFTANPSTDPEAQPIYEVPDLSKLHVSWGGAVVPVVPAPATMPGPLLATPLLLSGLPAPCRRVFGSGKPGEAAPASSQAEPYRTAPPCAAAGRHHHPRHTVGHGRHGHQADRGAHRHRRRLPHGDLHRGGAAQHTQDHRGRAHRHRVPPHRRAAQASGGRCRRAGIAAGSSGGHMHGSAGWYNKNATLCACSLGHQPRLTVCPALPPPPRAGAASAGF